MSGGQGVLSVFAFRLQKPPKKSCDTFRPSPPAPCYIIAARSGAKTPLRSQARLYFQQEWEKNVERKEKLNNEPRPCSTHEPPRLLSHGASPTCSGSGSGWFRRSVRFRWLFPSLNQCQSANLANQLNLLLGRSKDTHSAVSLFFFLSSPTLGW